MSTAGSSPRTAVPSSKFRVPSADAPGTSNLELGAAVGTVSGRRQRRLRLIRWRGLIPATLALAVVGAVWALFGEGFLKDSIEEAGAKALGAELDVAGLEIDARRTTVELRGVALADPFDRYRNLMEADLLRVELEPEPLLERKIVVRRVVVSGVRTGTRRTAPARPAPGGGFAPRALAEFDRWSKQFKVPLLSLTPIDTIKSVVLDPAQLKTAREALALAQRTDSVKRAIEGGYAALRFRETLDSARALGTRLQGANLRALGVSGVRTAVTDVRLALGRLDSTRRRLERLDRGARAGVELLQGGVRAIDAARRDDYDFARRLLKLPSFDSPQIGAALFGPVTIDKFQRAVYWTTLARQYAPPGLLPRESAGPKRLRRSGATVHFAKREAYPRFLLRRADIDLTIGAGAARGEYTAVVSDATTEPAVVGRPTRFALRREAAGSRVESLRVAGLLDHTGTRLRDVVAVQATGVRVPPIPLPALPFRAQPGRGTSELRLVMDGDSLSARWTLRSGELAWVADSARARQLNAMESLVARVVTGVRDFDLTAELSGPVRSPALTVRSNLDRAVAARLKEAAGQEVDRAVATARAQVDKIAEEKTAPVKARVAELRADVDRRAAEAKTRLDEERARLEARLKGLLKPGV